jgi:hypothetical protein
MTSLRNMLEGCKVLTMKRRILQAVITFGSGVTLGTIIPAYASELAGGTTMLLLIGSMFVFLYHNER